MAGGAWRRASARNRLLRALLRDTARALHDVHDLLPYDPEIPNIVEDITTQCCRPTALVILGNSSARARLLNCILGRRLLPDSLPRGCRWIKIQYGTCTQVRLTVGNTEFELVEELECNRRPWDTLPLQDLLRQDTDLGTTLEIDLNNSLLKDGLKILIPPDIHIDPGPYNYMSLKQIHIELYTKKSSILRNYVPIYLFALNRYGANIFSDNFTKVPTECWYKAASKGNENEWKDCDAVFTSENCLDLHQVRELEGRAQVLFVLLADSECECERAMGDATESAELCAHDLPESDQNILSSATRSPEQTRASHRRVQKEQITFMNELLDQWEFITNPPQESDVRSQWCIVDDREILLNVEKETEHTGKKRKEPDHDRVVKHRAALLNTVLKFSTECATDCLLHHCTRLSQIHVKLLQQFILASFDMARELQVVPKKIQYVATQEQQLYETLNKKFSEGDKKRELVQIMEEVLKEMRAEIINMDWSIDDLPCHQDQKQTSNSIFYSARTSPTISLSVLNNLERTDSDENNVEEAMSYESYNFDDYDIIHSNEESFCNSDAFDAVRSQSPSPLSNSRDIRIENEMELCSLSMLRTCSTTSTTSTTSTATVCTTTTSVSVKQASLDVQRNVLSKLSRKISLKLVQFLDCLKDTYFGTLQRCLESLEWSCRQELGGRPASEAMRQLLSVARQVDLTPCASFSPLTEIMDFLRRLFYKLRLRGGEAEAGCCPLSPAWRRRAALHTAHSLSPHRLARIISVRIVERLSVAHERYQSALTSLQSALASRLHHTEDVKLTIRKKFAPSFARLCLESTSMCDLLKYGTPELGREIGRGQYGVVYAARDSWAGQSPAAVKTVLPADDRHYHELAMEFFYTRSIPAHPRIVRLAGSLVRRGGGGAGAGAGPPAVWLVSQRCVRDLHVAVRAGLALRQRMLIAKDIVEGIRYLHSLGLVHRDIKLKNVLLDAHDRASLSDLGFCAAGALLSGSVVGTPVHMAPELLNGHYHAAIDVYAFGILFWYLCAGSIRLPAAFESFHNKEQLWNKVKRGLRPERLPHFSDECWEIMESCWASEPSQRALLGDIQPKLENILENTSVEQGSVVYDKSCHSDDSLDMTGLHERHI